MAELLEFFWSGKFITGFLTAGGLAGIWKLGAGWHRVNLTLAIENRRTPSLSSGTDELVSVLRLKKGDRATLAIDSIHIAVTSSQTEIAGGAVGEIALSQVPRTLNLTPGEETHFAFHCQPPAHAVCKVSATVTGRSLRNWSPLGVWKATEISVPLPQKARANGES